MLCGPDRQHSPCTAGPRGPAPPGSPCTAAAPALLEPEAAPAAVPGTAAASAPWSTPRAKPSPAQGCLVGTPGHGPTGAGEIIKGNRNLAAVASRSPDAGPSITRFIGPGALIAGPGTGTRPPAEAEACLALCSFWTPLLLEDKAWGEGRTSRGFLQEGRLEGRPDSQGDFPQVRLDLRRELLSEGEG